MRVHQKHADRCDLLGCTFIYATNGAHKAQVYPLSSPPSFRPSTQMTIDSISSSSVFCAIAAAVFCYAIFSARRLGQRLPNMPPGPPTIPILGNAMDMPRELLHVQFTEWCMSAVLTFFYTSYALR